MGLNLSKETYPEGVAATSLEELSGSKVSFFDSLGLLVKHILIVYDEFLLSSFSGLREEWLRGSAELGKRVRRSDVDDMVGVMKDVSEDGAELWS